MPSDEEIRLFVSHHSSKLDIAEHVERALAPKGIKCWIAPRDVDPGEPFDKEVKRAIFDSSAILLLFCSQSDKSRHVKRELILADQAGKAIIPLRLEKIDPGELSYHLADSQWIDWIEKRDETIDRIATKARQFHGLHPRVATAGNERAVKQVIEEAELSAPLPAPLPEPQPTPPPVPVTAVPPPPPVYLAEPAPASGSKTLLWVLAALLLAAAVGAAVYFALRGTDQDGGDALGTLANTAATQPVNDAAPQTNSAAPAAPSAPAGPEVLKYVIDDANIRTLPTAKGASKVTGKLKPGDQIRGVLQPGVDPRTQWFRLADGRGYVSIVNLSDAPQAKGDSPMDSVGDEADGGDTADTPQLCTVVDNTGSNLRIRAKPKGVPIGGMPSGVRVRVIEDAPGAWVKVQPEGNYPTGWVARAFLNCG